MAKAKKEELQEDLPVEIGTVSKDSIRAINSVKAALKKKFGDDVFSEKTTAPMPSISTGSALIDAEIGNSGLVLGRIHEIFGDTSSGKTTASTLIAANALRQYPDKYILYIDFEQALDMRYAKLLGLDVEDDRVMIVQPSSAEEGLEILYNMISTGAVSLVVVDSIPAMLTKRELENGFEAETMAEKARFLSKAVPKLLGVLKITKSMVLFVNQVRDKISYMGGKTTPGGRAVPYYASTRIEMARTGVLTSSDIAYGQEIKAYIRKNKVGQPYGIIESKIIFGHGFDIVGETVDLAVKKDIIHRGGAWFNTPCGERFQGKAPCIDFYKVNKDKYEELRALVMSGTIGSSDVDEDHLTEEEVVLQQLVEEEKE